MNFIPSGRLERIMVIVIIETKLITPHNFFLIIPIIETTVHSVMDAHVIDGCIPIVCMNDNTGKLCFGMIKVMLNIMDKIINKNINILY